MIRSSFSYVIRRVFVVFLAVFALHSLVACGVQSAPPQPIPAVASLRQYFPVILSRAYEWKQDAYPYAANLSFSQRDWLISVLFWSPTADVFQAIEVEVNPITEEILVTDFEPGAVVREYLEITEQNWKVDSTEAIEKFFTYPDVQDFYRRAAKDSFCNQLNLITSNHGGGKLAWRLLLSDCGLHHSSFLIDPLTGERIDFER